MTLIKIHTNICQNFTIRLSLEQHLWKNYCLAYRLFQGASSETPSCFPNSSLFIHFLVFYVYKRLNGLSIRYFPIGLRSFLSDIDMVLPIFDYFSLPRIQDAHGRGVKQEVLPNHRYCSSCLYIYWSSTSIWDSAGALLDTFSSEFKSRIQVEELAQICLPSCRIHIQKTKNFGVAKCFTWWIIPWWQSVFTD